ncbi:translocation/assembly module TamB domain-containing protein [Spongiivirga citrea]|uniref:Translocation/assembly module TamB n=1 Tax=Spongiivirga citrea TaxID=1481457 RepID=A0A6M0CPR8_9FLAO|nr:translocation/assembly module TamB domain-containing protein [Spongiivirga citrea]NER15920.1 translocation/assembly module TamB [Spongiivirga citrea]
MLLFLLLFIIFNIPAVQTYFARKATNSINKEFGTNINIGRVGLSLTGNADIKDIYIEDYKKDTLIYIKSLEASILGIKNAINGKLEFSAVDMDGLQFNLKTYKGEDFTNLDVFVDKLDTPSESTEPSSFLLKAADIGLENGVFRLIDENLETAEVLNFKNLFGQLSDFKISGPNVTTDINQMSFIDQRGLEMEQLKTKFSYSLSQMRFDELEINTKDSEVNGSLVFDYKREDMKEFTDKVKVNGSFVSSKISFNEINLFYDEFGLGNAYFSSDFTGTLNELELKKLNLVSSNTRIKGDMYFKDIFDSKQPFYMEADLKELTSNYQQLRRLLPDLLGKTLPSSFSKLGQFKIKGNTIISESMIDAQLTVDTRIGRSVSNLTLTNIENIDNASYEGVVELKGFDLGDFLNDPILGKASLKLNVDGKGFVQETLNTEIIGTVDTLQFNNYKYKNLEVSGVLKDQLFDGFLQSNDPNLKLRFDGLADFSKAENQFDFKANVGYANLNILNFIKRDSISIFRGDIDINTVGTNIDNMTGTLSFKKTGYQNQNDQYYFNDFNVSSSFKDSIRTLTFNSPDIVNGKLSGRFSINELDKLVQNSIGSIYANYSPYEVNMGQFIDFNFIVYNKIVEVFYPELKFGPNTIIRGRIAADNGEFKLNFRSPRIDVFDYMMDKVSVQIDNKNPLFNTAIEIGKIDAGFYQASNFDLINKTLRDTLFFKTNFKGGKQDNDDYNLSFYHTIDNKNRSVVGIQKSEVDFKGNRWYINKERDRKNRVVLNKTLDTISIEDISMNHEDEFINIRGVMLDSTYKDIGIGFKVVDLNKITPEVDSLRLDGVIDGKVNIIQRQGVYLPNSRMVISDFKVNKYEYGNLLVDVQGDERLRDFDVNASIVNGDIRPLFIKGGINKKARGYVYDLDVSLDKFKLDPFSPLGEDVIQRIRGDATGKAKISGVVDRPMINGYLELDNGGIYLPDLNVDLAMDNNSTIQLREESFIFDNINITDTAYRTRGNIDGSISHTYFDDWRLDLKVLAPRRLMVFDIPEGDEALYYGTAFISGEGDIFGPIDALTIKADARSEKGTSIVIPIDDTASVGDESFITFIDKNELKKSNAERRVAEEFKGIEMEFDLDITTEAQVSVVIDKKTGSKLSGSGVGLLLMQINTNGKFNMFGSFAAYEGIYNYKTLGGLYSRDFVVQPGGNIDWQGDPYGAQLTNMTAIYSLEANPAILLANGQDFNRKIPTEVSIILDGNFDELTPSFNIDFPNASGVVKSELQFAMQDEDQKQLQALSLITQGVFIDQVSISQQALTGNLFQTASNVFNDLISGDDDVLQLGVNYDQGDRSGLNNLRTEDRLGLTLSTRISDRILLNGKFGVPVGGVSQTVVVGNVEVDILLNQDGSLRAKVFNRENELQFAQVAENIGYTQGVGLSYEYDFDTFKELLHKIFKKADKDAKKEKKPKRKKDSVAEPALVNFRPKKSTSNK